ncbi:hypothetical protein LP420_07230 [Massilia sp. B-10]|nr:hypothetical protein LP420_07230 [Massilia sp. B-10]
MSSALASSGRAASSLELTAMASFDSCAVWTLRNSVSAKQFEHEVAPFRSGQAAEGRGLVGDARYHACAT